MNILIYCDPKPIPVRIFDYQAIDVDAFGESSHVGFGATPEAARDDLMGKLLADVPALLKPQCGPLFD
jgi:hypothetical protein